VTKNVGIAGVGTDVEMVQLEHLIAMIFISRLIVKFGDY